MKRHIIESSTKGEKCALALARIMPNRGGASSSNRKIISSVVFSKILYGISVWYSEAIKFYWLLEVNFYLTQFLSGHGNFGSYLNRFKIKESAACTFFGEIDTPEHTFLKCPKWKDNRDAIALFT